ncbi:diacylglycerol kinase [Ascidiaceihabitans sp.]|nr:diacylglycerol kinase [Ascidiaceihabitans sp.]
MTSKNVVVRPKPDRITGIKHLFAAASYSVGGIRRLWQETAFRHIILMLVLCLTLLFVIGANLTEFSILLILFFALVAVEALNTAIECIVDHLAPNWEEFARDAKDLGSLATMCLLFANGLYLSVLFLRFFEII